MNTPATLFTASESSNDHFITSDVPALCGRSTTGVGGVFSVAGGFAAHTS
jgi:hypothetical protein